MRRSRVALAAALTTALLASGHAAGSDPSAVLDQLLTLLAARHSSHVRFTEVHEMAMLDRPLESSGELLYEAPDHLEKRTLRPKAETLVLEHGVLSATRGHRTYVLRLGDYPQVVPFVESIRATLAGDRAALERFFRVDFQGELEHWTLTLVPTDAAIRRKVAEIRIAGERDVIRTVEIRQSDADRTVMTIGPEITP
ncbi:MAG TPA: LolA-related protein [Steroidobacteraceae bacterium]|nr:LolA-related protein [Steroidobacteraceae bacterium]